MTNAEILFNAGQHLLEEGILKPTGRMFKFECPDGSTIERAEPEAFHTFNHWKALGYKVKRGEHAIARIQIWKYGEKKRADDAPDDEQPEGHCFMKTACFFSASQVEPA